ncbi:MAG: type I glutamate--ammonia ligase [Anaerolineae bacterium]|nr:type I glutamate--ammonia ligase [Anaerolineae bacterium]
MSIDKAAVERVAEIIATQNVRFINLQFTDIAGIVKQITIPLDQWNTAVDHGIWFDGSSIEGFARIAESDMYLVPDLDTFAVVPWGNDDVATARVICDVYTPNGEPFAGDPRYVLKRALAKAEEMGYIYNTGPELEFFLFKPHANGDLLPLEPHDLAGYFDVSTDLAHTVRRQMVRALQAFGIEVEAGHHEVAIGQHEIDFKYGNALRTADNAVTLRITLKAIAQINGLYCTFMPKPIQGINGSGMHVHQSLMDKRTGKNAFVDPNGLYGLSQLALSFVAGQLAHARGFSAVIAPLVNSYKRLVPGYEAPVYISWARMNRSALIRVPRVRPAQPQSTRVELRCPDPSANPYLAFAVMLHAGLDGIAKGMQPPAPAEEDLYHIGEERRRELRTMPGSLAEAIEELEADPLMREALGDHIYERYIEAKRLEWDEYRISVSKWELDRYLSIY